MDAYLQTLLSFGPEYAFRQLNFDILLNWRGMSGQGKRKALDALIGFASR